FELKRAGTKGGLRGPVIGTVKTGNRFYRAYSRRFLGVIRASGSLLCSDEIPLIGVCTGGTSARRPQESQRAKVER
ncbi:MAG: hypothetical protein ACYS21_16660, partial [Planctomycetota bacterium]